MTPKPHLPVQHWWQQPSAAMLAVLLLSLVIYPYADESRSLRVFAQALDVTVVLMVVRLIRAQVVWLRSGWVIAIPTVLLQLWHLALPESGIELALLVSQVVFHGYAAAVLLGYVLLDDTITLDELFAIAGVYVLLALFWASAYAIVIHYDPGAIYINEVNNLDGRVGFADLVYYSITTITSTGYGEITPVSPAARALAMLQQVTGGLFVAIRIARLTGMYRLRPR